MEDEGGDDEAEESGSDEEKDEVGPDDKRARIKTSSALQLPRQRVCAFHSIPG